MILNLNQNELQGKLDIAWAAGIIEGEGCFCITTKNKTTNKYVKIQVSMTDFDIIERLKAVFNCGYINHRPPAKHQEFAQAAWKVGKQLDVYNVLVLILPYLGKRRTLKAKECIEFLDKNKKSLLDKQRQGMYHIKSSGVLRRDLSYMDRNSF